MVVHAPRTAVLVQGLGRLGDICELRFPSDVGCLRMDLWALFGAEGGSYRAKVLFGSEVAGISRSETEITGG
jgi:hypothetical protein